MLTIMHKDTNKQEQREKNDSLVQWQQLGNTDDGKFILCFSSCLCGFVVRISFFLLCSCDMAIYSKSGLGPHCMMIAGHRSGDAHDSRPLVKNLHADGPSPDHAEQ